MLMSDKRINVELTITLPKGVNALFAMELTEDEARELKIKYLSKQKEIKNV
jgi:hypothetical protein